MHAVDGSVYQLSSERQDDARPWASICLKLFVHMRLCHLLLDAKVNCDGGAQASACTTYCSLRKAACWCIGWQKPNHGTKHLLIAADEFDRVIVNFTIALEQGPYEGTCRFSISTSRKRSRMIVKTPRKQTQSLKACKTQNIFQLRKQVNIVMSRPINACRKEAEEGEGTWRCYSSIHWSETPQNVKIHPNRRCLR